MEGRRIKSRKKSGNKIFIFLIFIISLFTFIFSTFNIIKYLIENNRNKKINANLSNAIIVNENAEDKEKKYQIDFKKLESINGDTVGYIKVYGTDIDYIVVQGEDNSYYLEHNFNKERNVAGWVFADYKNQFDGSDKNIVIYGHNMRNGTMFGTLDKALKKEWMDNEQNRIIYLVTKDKTIKYEVFSVYEIADEDYYIKTEFEYGEFDDFVNTVSQRSFEDFGVKINDTDSILTLSTCGNNNKYRTVLHAKKIIE